MPERYREIRMKTHDKCRVDSTEGVKTAGNWEGISDREQVPRQEVGRSESKDRMKSN
jgi:hypothetical protein